MKVITFQCVNLVMQIIGKSHECVHDMGCPRICTDIRIGTRIDKVQHMEDKVSSVEAMLKESKDTR